MLGCCAAGRAACYTLPTLLLRFVLFLDSSTHGSGLGELFFLLLPCILKISTQVKGEVCQGLSLSEEDCSGVEQIVPDHFAFGSQY